MLIGLVKWFNDDNGYGIIETPEEGEFFLHINNFSTKPQSISKGTAVIFKKKVDPKTNRNTAENCRLVGDTEDWEIILNYLGKPESISIEIEIAGRGKRGNPYRRKETKSYSLMELSAKQMFKGKNEHDLVTIIKNYFNDTLDVKYFIQYCELLEKITKTIDKEKTTNLLNEVYIHFGNNLNETILFYAWKSKNFKFISYTDADDYEIPVSVLKNFEFEIGVSELRRILGYEFGSLFCKDFINSKFSEVKKLTIVEIKDLYQFLEFAIVEEKEEQKRYLDNLYVEKFLSGITEQANNLGVINNDDDFAKYNRLKQLISNQIEEDQKIKIVEIINKIIEEKSTQEYKPELWVKGIIDNAPFELVLEKFIDNETDSDKRTTILSKLQLQLQFELLKAYSGNLNWKETFCVLENLVKKENSLGYSFELSKVIFDEEYWKEKKCYDLIGLFTQYANDNATDAEKYDLFFIGLIKDFPQKLVKQNIEKLGKEECSKIFSSKAENINFTIEFLLDKVRTSEVSDIDWLYDLGTKFLDAKNFIRFDQKVFETIDSAEYFKLWKKGKAKIFPKSHIESLLNEKYESYNEIETWIANEVITKEDIKHFIISYLKEHIPVTDRKIFFRQFNHIKYLTKIDELCLGEIKQIGNDFYKIIFWFLGIENALDYDLLKSKFIYFLPEEQVKIIRKLFSLKARGEFDLTIEKLNELTRADLDLYKTNLKFDSSISLDISTDVIIKALINYKNKQKFLVESEVLSLVLNDLKEDKTRRFKLANYFEMCMGREIANFDWKTNGEISKVEFGDNQFYFAINFPTGEPRWVNNNYGGREVFIANPNFEKLKEAVKILPKSKWNPAEKHWGVSSQYENEVLAFAKDNHFFINFEGNNYANNIHLANYTREETPNGISFCEGRLANKQHEIYKKNFWWCAGRPCFQKCETSHNTEEWESYTLLDFCQILELNTDETSSFGDVIPKGHYYQFIGLINRFNQLLEKIYCQDCNEILHPVETGHFAARAVVRFCCENNVCGQHKKEVYLNHCLNGQCNGIIDSRVSKKCSNGLFICDSCGSCCSHEMLKRRLNNLQTTGGYIQPNLAKCVDEKLGHLERAEYFCYKCKNNMDEISTDIFHCHNCEVTYDTTKYKLKRPHRHLRTNL